MGPSAEGALRRRLRLGWRQKARVMQVCASVPWGDRFYRRIQRSFGRLRDDPRPAFRGQIELARWFLQAGRPIDGRSFLEVGTGHLPLVPVGFFLCGAERVRTVDLHRRLEWGLLGRALRWIARHPDEVGSLFAGVVASTTVQRRLELVARTYREPVRFLAEAGIEYLAPCDAARTGLPEGSVDGHFSRAVLEHIGPPALREVLAEARRLIAPDGVALHFVDLHDHFQSQDPSITRINFLQFSEEEWLKLAGNEFAYCNRLRIRDLLDLFREVGFEVMRHETRVDGASLEALRAGFQVHDRFRSYPPEELCTTELRVLLRAAEGRA
jgi:SAM-dependent methyltransferase